MHLASNPEVAILNTLNRWDIETNSQSLPPRAPNQKVKNWMLRNTGSFCVDLRWDLCDIKTKTPHKQRMVIMSTVYDWSLYFSIQRIWRLKHVQMNRLLWTQWSQWTEEPGILYGNVRNCSTLFRFFWHCRMNGVNTFCIQHTWRCRSRCWMIGWRSGWSWEYECFHGRIGVDPRGWKGCCGRRGCRCSGIYVA